MEARKLMTLEVTAVPPELLVAQAHALMSKIGARHLPVVLKGKLAGILSDRDILSVMVHLQNGAATYPTMRVGEIMSLSPVSAGPEASLSEIAGVMIAQKIDAVPIVDKNNQLVGLVTSTDLLNIVSMLPATSQPQLSYQVRRVEPDVRA